MSTARSSLFLASLSLTSLALAACSGDDTNPPAPPVADAGADAAKDATTSTEAGADAGPEASAGEGGDAGTTAAIQHIFFIMMENHATSEIIGNTADAPYINTLASQYGVAANYFGVTHPSLPNYLAAISGDFQGIWDDCAAGPTVTCAPEEFVPNSGDDTANQPLTPAEIASATSTAHWFTGQNLVDQLEAKSLTWKAYMQSIPAAGSTVAAAPMGTGADGGPAPLSVYVQKHNPFMYFTDIRSNPTRMNLIVPLTQLATDLSSAATTPSFVWISPDACHDMHGASASTANDPAVNLPDCAYPASGLDHKVIALGDAFLQTTVAAIMASPAWKERSVIVIPWDEDDYAGYAGCCDSPTGMDGGVLGGANAPALVITSVNPKPQSSAAPFNHYSMLATIEQLWGLGCLANACNITDAGAGALMTPLFTP